MCSKLATRDQLNDAIRTDQQARDDARLESFRCYIEDYFGKAYAELLVVTLTEGRYVEIKTAHGTVFGCLVDAACEYEGAALGLFHTLPRKDTRWARRRVAISKKQGLEILHGTKVA